MPVNDTNLEYYINSLTEETSPDTNDDMLLLLDTSGSMMKKISPTTLLSENISSPPAIKIYISTTFR